MRNWRAICDFDAQVELKQALLAANHLDSSVAAAREEVACDYAGQLWSDGDTMEQFIQQNQHRPSLLKRLAEAFRELWRKLTGKERTQAEEAAYRLEKAYEKAVEAQRKAGKKGITIGGKERLSLSNIQDSGTVGVPYDYTKSFAEQIEDWKSGKIPKNDTLLIGKTSLVLKKIGLSDVPITINQQHIDYAINGSKDMDHALGVEGLKQIPTALEHPVAIISSGSKTNTRLVVMLEIRQNGKQVIAPVTIDGYGTLNLIPIGRNAITSVYGNRYSISRVLKNALDAEANGNPFSVYYVDREKATRLFEAARVPMPKMPQIQPDGFVHSIREKGSPVKPKLESVTQSQQFKRWFGDWEKHPETASKVVNEDGTPMVMYHGSPAQFTIFERKKAKSSGMYGRGFYFTNSETHAGQYGNQYSVYLNIRNPLEHGRDMLTESQVRKYLEAVAENEDFSIENYGTDDIEK